MHNEFYKEIKRRNKNKFVAARSREIEALQTGVDIPAFLYAEQEYKEHQTNGNIDNYGNVKAGV